METTASFLFKKMPNIIVTCPKDRYEATAVEDGVTFTTDIPGATSKADVVFLLVPDQFQPDLFNKVIAPTLKPACCIVVASGYNYFYGKLAVHPSCDVVMVAPRMIGTSVRSLFVSGQGYPCFVSAEQNGSGKAEQLYLAIALGVGALKQGAIKSSCREETLIDLFAEQALFPAVISIFQEAYSTLRGFGASDEALCCELFLSKELAEIFEKMADDGFMKQLVHHSTVSQYGQLRGSLDFPEAILGPMRSEFQRVAKNRVLNGAFEKDFSKLESNPGGVQAELDRLYAEAEKSELGQGEIKARARLNSL